MAKVRKRQWVTPSGEQREAWIVDFNPFERCGVSCSRAKLKSRIDYNSLAGSRSHA